MSVMAADAKLLVCLRNDLTVRPELGSCLPAKTKTHKKCRKIIKKKKLNEGKNMILAFRKWLSSMERQRFNLFICDP